MQSENSKIIIFDPEVIFWGVAAGFHGYAITFIDKYADCIYLNKGVKDRLRYRRQLWRMGIRRYIPFINELKSSKKEDKLIGFVIPSKDDDNIRDFVGKKFFHLMDYYLFVSRNKEFLCKYKVDYVIGHTAMDKNCEFFKLWYPEYIGRVISLPFGYQERFKNRKKFEERKNIAVGLGSINPVNDPRLDEETKAEFVDYFKNESFMHPLRRYIQTHEMDFIGVIDSKFPSPDKQKDFSYDAVEVLNNYRMFINDAGLSNFPPARTYEGIACGCVMVAENRTIYREIGFIPDVNYISFDNGDYIQMRDKIRFYIDNPDKLLDIQKKSLLLAEQYSHYEVSKRFMKEILNQK